MQKSKINGINHTFFKQLYDKQRYLKKIYKQNHLSQCSFSILNADRKQETQASKQNLTENEKILYMDKSGQF